MANPLDNDSLLRHCWYIGTSSSTATTDNGQLEKVQGFFLSLQYQEFNCGTATNIETETKEISDAINQFMFLSHIISFLLPWLHATLYPTF